MPAPQILLKTLVALAITCVVAGIANEIRCYKLGRRRITRGQIRLRVVTALLLLTVLGMILVAGWVLPDGAREFRSLTGHQRSVVLSYWTLCLALLCLIFVLALADIRACIRNYIVRRGEMFLSPGEDREHRN